MRECKDLEADKNGFCSVFIRLVVFVSRKLISFHGVNFGQISSEGILNLGGPPGLGA